MPHSSDKKAVALRYEGDSAPKISAGGRNHLAHAIIEKARAFNIPIFQNKELVDSLINLDIDDEITPESYLAVAKILLWLSESENKAQMSGAFR